MEVILLEDNKHLGERGDVVEVADGYARNFLIPNRKALANTPSNKASFESEEQFKKIRMKKEKKSAREMKEKLDNKELRIVKKSGKEGKLYGSVTNQDVAEVLEKEGFEIDRRNISLEEPVHSTGEHRVNIHLFEGINATLTLFVEGEEEEEEGEE